MPKFFSHTPRLPDPGEEPSGSRLSYPLSDLETFEEESITAVKSLLTTESKERADRSALSIIAVNNNKGDDNSLPSEGLNFSPSYQNDSMDICVDDTASSKEVSLNSQISLPVDQIMTSSASILVASSSDTLELADKVAISLLERDDSNLKTLPTPSIQGNLCNSTTTKANKRPAEDYPSRENPNCLAKISAVSPSVANNPPFSTEVPRGISVLSMRDKREVLAGNRYSATNKEPFTVFIESDKGPLPCHFTL